MNDFFDTALSTLMRLLWAADPHTQTAVLAVLALAVSSLLLVYGPLCLRLANAGTACRHNVPAHRASASRSREPRVYSDSNRLWPLNSLSF